MDLLKSAKAIASSVRLTILDELKDPIANFPPQSDGDLIMDGVCSDFHSTEAEHRGRNGFATFNSVDRSKPSGCNAQEGLDVLSAQ